MREIVRENDDEEETVREKRMVENRMRIRVRERKTRDE